MDAAWPHLEDDRLRSIYEGNALPGSEQEEPRLDHSLHGYLIEKADNFYIRDFFSRHSRYYEILFTWESLDREAAIAAVHQHRKILEALLARDRDAARAALMAHIRYSHPRLQEQLSDAQAAPPLYPSHAV